MFRRRKCRDTLECLINAWMRWKWHASADIVAILIKILFVVGRGPHEGTDSSDLSITTKT